MQRNEIIEAINQKNLEAKKIINEINDLKKLLSNYDNQSKTNFTNEEKVNIFMDYFKGRDSIYPYLSIDKKDPNKKYYIPKCANEWNKNVCYKTMGKKCKDCNYWVDKPIDKEVIRNHLFYHNPIGIYPMLEDESCYFLAFDFDDKKNENDIKEDVLAFASICDKYNVPISIERSRSGHGIHVWIFFNNNVKTITARKMGSLLLSKTMEIRDNLKIDSFDRMFPNQDTMPKGGYGSLIALPFQNEPMKYNNTAFLDRSFIAYDDQYGYLRSVKKMSHDEIFSVIKILSENTIDISNEDVELKEEIKNKQKNNFDFPKSIDITLDNMPTPRDSIGIPNTNNPLNMQAPKGGVPTVQDAKKVQSEYKPPSKFKTFLLIIFFIGLIAFIMFLPEIKDYLEEFQNRGKTEENVKITTGKLKCNKKTNTKTLDKDYDLVFHFKDNKLEKTEFSITTRGDATSDEEELNGLASTCKQLEKEAESLNGLYVKCTLTTGKLEEIQSFDLSILDTEKLDAAFSEAGGNNPEYQYQQDMDKIEQSMNASGYTCVRER